MNNLELLDKIADIILIDTGAGLSDNVISMIMAADEVLVVTTPDPTSMTDAYALIKMISNRDRMKKIKIIVNRAENAEEANSILNKLVLVSSKFLNVKVEDGGHILYDEAVVKSVKQQRPFTLEFPRSQAAKSIRQITDNVFRSTENVATTENYGVSSFINRFINLMRH
jgi:flagellar biosynthesis protein FlhG